MTDETVDSEDDHNEDDLPELSLDDLGAAYARAAAEHDPESFQVESVEPDDEAELDEEELGAGDEPQADDDEGVVTPEAIVEAALFVGHPENRSFSEQKLASLMRDVTPDEIVELIKQLNQSYKDTDQALRIVQDEHGYRMTIAPGVEAVRRSFLGKVREARLSQSAIEVLALVAYQPGIDSQTVQDQRGRESASLLSQLVRRRLLEIQREKPDGGGRAIARYYPTERFLALFALESLDDLPQVEEGLHEGL